MDMGEAPTIGECGAPLLPQPRFGLAADYEATQES
jgi:hypothetical protein